ncbi:MAG: hypothetical protein KY468_15925 [Armatimonadetes bacterium]|nr:hypothetical protein [Armatimonadota bacterium]
MKALSLSLPVAALFLSVSAYSQAATTPEGTLKEFLAAMKKKDRAAITKSIDWDAMKKSLKLNQGTPEQQDDLMKKVRIIYVESFALGDRAKNFKISPVTVKGNEAKGTFMQMNAATKKWVPTTQFSLRKNGKNWLISSISGAKS